MSKTTHYTTTGRFNILGNERDQQVVLCTPYGTVSALWPEDEAPYDAGMSPTEVSAILRDRIKSYLYISSRDETLAKLDEIDRHGDELDCDWMLARAERLEQQADDLIKQAKRLRFNAEQIADDAEAA